MGLLALPAFRAELSHGGERSIREVTHSPFLSDG